LAARRTTRQELCQCACAAARSTTNMEYDAGGINRNFISSHGNNQATYSPRPTYLKTIITITQQPASLLRFPRNCAIVYDDYCKYCFFYYYYYSTNSPYNIHRAPYGARGTVNSQRWPLRLVEGRLHGATLEYPPPHPWWSTKHRHLMHQTLPPLREVYV
jgi:hypothetical protein